MSTLPPRKRKKKTKNQYFTQATEDAIVRYNSSSDPEERSKIYRDEIWLGIIDSSLEPEYTDYYIDYEFEHEYCIESINDCGESNWVCDIGYGALGLGDINDDSEDTMSPQSRTATITVLLNDTLFIRLLILMNYSNQFWPVRSEYISHFSPTSYDLNFSAF